MAEKKDREWMQREIQRDLLKFWVGSHDPVDELAHARVMQHNGEALDLGMEDSQTGFQGLVNLFLNSMAVVSNFYVMHSGKSPEDFYKSLSKQDMQEGVELVNMLENNFRQNLFDIMRGKDSLFSRN